MIKVIYWSGTGNTKMMAEEIAKACDAEVLEVSEASITDIKEADAIALGCPSMGMEVLEETTFGPFVEDIKGALKDKKLALFGSYDWGDGEWMRNWEDEMENSGAYLVSEGLKIHLTPDEEGLEKCRELGDLLK